MAPVIDVHCHLTAMGPAAGGILSRKARNNYAFRAMLVWYGFRRGGEDDFDSRMVANLVRQVRESTTVDKAVALALDGVYDRAGRLDEPRTHCYIPNDYVFDVARRHGAEILPGASVNPARADALDELERVKAAGAVLIKWVPNSQDFDPADKKFIPFYTKMAALGLPLLSHTGYEHCVPVTDQMYGDPSRLKTALAEGVTVIAGHAGCAGHRHPVEFVDDFIKMLDAWPNLYADLAALTSLSRFGYAARLASLSGSLAGRFIQATDFPVVPFPFLYAGRMPVGEIARLMLVRNIFDCDAGIKRALGFGDDIFSSAARVLGVSG